MYINDQENKVADNLSIPIFDSKPILRIVVVVLANNREDEGSGGDGTTIDYAMPSTCDKKKLDLASVCAR